MKTVTPSPCKCQRATGNPEVYSGPEVGFWEVLSIDVVGG
jgi:hypothetical protein